MMTGWAENTEFNSWLDSDEDLDVEDWIQIPCPGCNGYTLSRTRDGREYCVSNDCDYGK